MKRRDILGLGMALVSTSVAGCTQYWEDNRVRIGKAVVGNRDSTSGHTIRVVVEFNGEPTYDEVHEFEKMRNSIAPYVDFTEDLPVRAGSYLIKAYLDEAKRPEVMDVNASAPSDCTFVNIISEPDNKLSLLYSGGCNNQTREKSSSLGDMRL